MSQFRPHHTTAIAGVVLLAGAAYFAFRADHPQPPSTTPQSDKTQPGIPEALLHIDHRPPSPLPGSIPPSADEAKAYRKELAALVKSEFVVNAALRDPRVRGLGVVREQSEPAAWLTARLTAECAEGSSVLRIRVPGVPPREAAILVNAVAAAFLTEVAEKDVKALRERQKRLEDAQAELARVLDSRKQALNMLAAGSGVPPNAADHRALVASLYQERCGLRVELARARSGKDGCPEPGAREKHLREDLAALDERIKSCERADLELLRGEVARLEAALASVASEITRIQFELASPSRVKLLAPAGPLS